MPESPSELVELFYRIYHWIGVYYWVLLIATAAFALLFLSVCKFERRCIRQFKQVDETKLPPPSFYTVEMNAQASKLGFHNCGWYAQDRGGLYHATATMWVSPDNLTMLIVGGGKIAGIDYKTTVLLSKPVDAAVLVTSDEMGEVDITGLFDREFLISADLEELWKLHKSRLAFWEGKLDKFNRSDVLAEFEELSRRHARVLIEHGLGRWLDKLREQWRYTIKGSIRLYLCYRTESRKIKKQKDRLSKRKPGESLGGFAAMGTVGRARDLLMPPSQIIEDAGVGLGAMVLDFGCGDWTCSIAAAEEVGPEGTVYALDIHPDACEEVKKRAAKRRLTNIKTIQSDCMTGLSDQCVDIIFLHEVLHALPNKKQMVLNELHRVLKDNGILSFSDHYMKEKEIIALMTGQGLFTLLKRGQDLYKFTKLAV